MESKDISSEKKLNKLHQGQWLISTIANNAPETAIKYGLGLEITDFAVAAILDKDLSDKICQFQEILTKINCPSILHATYMEITPAAIDPAVLRLTYSRYLQAYQIARKLGINRIVYHTGYTPQIYHRCWMKERAIEFWLDFIDQLAPDVEILWENVLEQDPYLQLEICQAINDSRFRACLDLGHANSVNSSYSLTEWISALAPCLSHVHLHDNNGLQDSHLDLGKGSIDLEAILDHLFSLCPGISVTLEVPEPELSLRWLGDAGYI
ncbi:MAG TPA: sugar phosphate isomerase/epimerase [Clostridiaceae bacterium]|nr:sugar phosphate isomerase/epimerase [Clostridiaceae bacterium]